MRSPRSLPLCTSCGQRGHLADGDGCSPSYVGALLHRHGMSLQEAASRVGISKQAVFYAAKRMRRQVAEPHIEEHW